MLSHPDVGVQMLFVLGCKPLMDFIEKKLILNLYFVLAGLLSCLTALVLDNFISLIVLGPVGLIFLFGGISFLRRFVILDDAYDRAMRLSMLIPWILILSVASKKILLFTTLHFYLVSIAILAFFLIQFCRGMIIFCTTNQFLNSVDNWNSTRKCLFVIIGLSFISLIFPLGILIWMLAILLGLDFILFYIAIASINKDIDQRITEI